MGEIGCRQSFVFRPSSFVFRPSSAALSVVHLLRERARRIQGLFAALDGNARVIVITEGVAAISFGSVSYTHLTLPTN